MYNLYVKEVKKKTEHTLIIKGNYNSNNFNKQFIIEYYGAGINIVQGGILESVEGQIEKALKKILGYSPYSEEKIDKLLEEGLYIRP